MKNYVCVEEVNIQRQRATEYIRNSLLLVTEYIDVSGVLYEATHRRVPQDHCSENLKFDLNLNREIFILQSNRFVIYNQFLIQHFVKYLNEKMLAELSPMYIHATQL